jgi:hypothetical protein
MLKYEPIMRSLRSFEVLLSPGRISTKPGQQPCKKKTDANLKEMKAKLESNQEVRIICVRHQNDVRAPFERIAIDVAGSFQQNDQEN